MGDDVSLDARQRTYSSAWNTWIGTYSVAGPSGIDECNAAVRISAQNKLLNVRGVKALFSDAVAKEDDTVAGFQCKIRALSQCARNANQHPERKCRNSFPQDHSSILRDT